MKRPVLTLVLALAAAGCAPTHYLPEGTTRLAENRIVFTEGKEAPDPSALVPYLRQKANSKWNIWQYTSPVVFDSTLVRESAARMVGHMEYLGYYGATADVQIQEKDRNTTVTYRIDPGRSYKLSKISYIIRDPEMNHLLTEAADSLALKPGDQLSQKALEAESVRLAAFFRERGYYGLSKNHFFFEADSSAHDGTAQLTVRLEDYTRNESPSAARPHHPFKFGDVNIIPVGDYRVNPDFLYSLNKIHSGKIYNETDIATTYNRYSSIPLFNSVNIALQERDSNLVDCTIELKKSKLQSIKLGFEGSFNSTGLLGVTPSVSYSHKNIFGGGELLSLGFRGNFQFRLDDNIHSNEYAASASLQFPRFLGLPRDWFEQSIPNTEISGAFNWQSRPEYTRNITSLSYGYKWSGSRHLFYQLYPLKLNFVKIYDITADFYDNLKDPYLINAYKDHMDFGSEASLYYTTDATVNPRNSYFYVRAGIGGAGNVLSLFNRVLATTADGSAHTIFGVPYSQYVRGEISMVPTLRFGRRNQFAVAARALAGIGYAYGNATSLPFEKLFYAGGANSLRGWQARSVGPGGATPDDSFTIPNQSGDLHLEANLEFRFPLFWKFQGGLFADGGNVWNLGGNPLRDPITVFRGEDFLKTCALDWGFGLRLDIDMLLVRVDFGIKLYDPVSQAWRGPDQWFTKGGYALHFGIGYPF